MRSWSVSSIRSFHGCQLAWWFRRNDVQPEFTPVPLVAGIVLHEALAHDLRAQLEDGKRPSTAEVHELIDAVWFLNETGPPIKFGRLDREATLERLRRMYDHFREQAPLEGDVVAVEVAVRGEIPGARLPMVGYADVVVERPSGTTIVDFKTAASRPSPDPYLQALDIQSLALAHGWSAVHGGPTPSFEWIYITKTAKTACVTVPGGVPPARSRDRLVSIVNTTITAMADVLEGRRAPVPTQAPFTMCRTCPYRVACAAWEG